MSKLENSSQHRVNFMNINTTQCCYDWDSWPPTKLLTSAMVKFSLVSSAARRNTNIRNTYLCV